MRFYYGFDEAKAQSKTALASAFVASVEPLPDSEPSLFFGPS